MKTDPYPCRGVRIEGSSPQQAFGERATSNEALTSPYPGNSRRTQWVVQLAAGEASVNTQAQAVDFQEADLPTKSALVESLAQVMGPDPLWLG